MRAFFSASFLAFAVVVSGCAGSAKGRPAAVAVGADGRGWVEPAKQEAAPAAAAPHASRADGERASAAMPWFPVERPGLGTEWGDSRSSPVHEVTFLRAEPGVPFDTLRIHYDDAEGVNARAARAGGRGFYGPDDGYEHRGGWAAPGGWGHAVDAALVDDDGRPFDSVVLPDGPWFVGQHGESYAIVLRNRTPQRIEAVATVDGLDVISGRAGSVGARGYLLAPYGTVTIEGFRRSRNEVAEFRFGSVRDSYAARKGSDRDVGVIGVALFEERGDVVPSPPYGGRDPRDSADPFPGDRRRRERGYAEPPP